MRVAVAGTPGTGKTTATDLLRGREDMPEVVHLNDIVREHDLVEAIDTERDSLVVDVEAVRDWLADAHGDGDLLVESHLAHLLDADRVVVLRAHPERIHERLLDRGESAASADENARSEALDVVLSEAVERHGRDAVYEVDTRDRGPEAVADEITAVVRGERDPAAGIVDFTDSLVGGPASGPGHVADGADDPGGGDGA